MTRLALLMVLLPASLAWGQVSATLEASLAPPEGPAPYRSATLTVRNDLGRAIEAVALRAGEGGPTLVYPLQVAPGRQRTLEVALPAISPDQLYTLGALDRYSNGLADGEADVLTETLVPVAWLAEQVSREAMVRPAAFEAFADLRVDWPAELRRRALVLLGGVVVLAGFVLLIHPPRLRLVGLVGLVAAATGVLAWSASAVAPPPAEANQFELLLRGPDNRLSLRTLTVLAGRRSVQAHARTANAWVLYPDLAALVADTTVLRPAEPAFSDGASVTYRAQPGRLRMLVAQGPIPSGMPYPPEVQLVPSAEGWTLTPDRSAGPGLLVLGGRFVPVGSLTIRTPRRLSADSALPLERLHSAPAEFGLTPATLRLLRWLDATRRFEPPYLAWPVERDGQVQLLVTALP